MWNSLISVGGFSFASVPPVLFKGGKKKKVSVFSFPRRFDLQKPFRFFGEDLCEGSDKAEQGPGGACMQAMRARGRNNNNTQRNNSREHAVAPQANASYAQKKNIQAVVSTTAVLCHVTHSLVMQPLCIIHACYSFPQAFWIYFHCNRARHCGFGMLFARVVVQHGR